MIIFSTLHFLKCAFSLSAWLCNATLSLRRRAGSRSAVSPKRHSLRVVTLRYPPEKVFVGALPVEKMLSLRVAKRKNSNQKPFPEGRVARLCRDGVRDTHYRCFINIFLYDDLISRTALTISLSLLHRRCDSFPHRGSYIEQLFPALFCYTFFSSVNLYRTM